MNNEESLDKMLEEFSQEELNSKSDKEKIADLIVENQMLEHKMMVLAALAIGASKVLDYYASSSLAKPTFTMVDYSKEDQPLYSKAKYKVTEVLDTKGPDKEFLVGMNMYDLNIDTETAQKTSQQILEKIKELGIIIEEKYEEPTEESFESKDKQLHLDFNEGEIDEN